MSVNEHPETPTPSTQGQSAMTEHQKPWPDAAPRTDPTAALDTNDPLGSAGSRESATTAPLPHLPQQTAPPTASQSASQTASQTAPLRVEPATVVPDDRISGDEMHAQRSARPDSTDWMGAPRRPLVTVARGPRPVTVLFGLVSIMVAAYVLVVNLGGAAPDLGTHLPAIVGVAGGLLLVVGLVGLVLGRRRR